MRCPSCDRPMKRGVVQVSRGAIEEMAAPFNPGGAVQFRPDSGRSVVVLKGGESSRAYLCSPCGAVCFATSLSES